MRLVTGEAEYAISRGVDLSAGRILQAAILHEAQTIGQLKSRSGAVNPVLRIGAAFGFSLSDIVSRIAFRVIRGMQTVNVASIRIRV